MDPSLHGSRANGMLRTGKSHLRHLFQMNSVNYRRGGYWCEHANDTTPLQGKHSELVMLVTRLTFILNYVALVANQAQMFEHATKL